VAWHGMVDPGAHPALQAVEQPQMLFHHEFLRRTSGPVSKIARVVRYSLLGPCPTKTDLADLAECEAVKHLQLVARGLVLVDVICDCQQAPRIVSGQLETAAAPYAQWRLPFSISPSGVPFPCECGAGEVAD
jgi:hypothetical protein